MEMDERISTLLWEISQSEKYAGCVFSAPGIFFIIENGKIREISNDVSGSPRGGWFPDLVTGPTEEENACLKALMNKLDFDEYFFDEVLEEIGEFDEEAIVEYFEENDEDSLEIYEKMARKIEAGKTPFESMDDFVNALKRYGLCCGVLYYEWEGDYVDLHENIEEIGEEPGYYDSLSKEEWISILEDIDNHIVTA